MLACKRVTTLPISCFGRTPVRILSSSTATCLAKAGRNWIIVVVVVIMMAMVMVMGGGCVDW